MPHYVDSDEFAARVTGAKLSALRFEQQSAYNVPGEYVTLGRWVVGDPQHPDEREGSVQWRKVVAESTARGVRWARVRVHDDPPNIYQRWLRWAGQWNVAAGEDIRYLTQQQAQELMILPAAGDTDWWLIDGDTLLITEFDQLHKPARNELVTEAGRVAQAREWWDLAFLHAAPVTVEL